MGRRCLLMGDFSGRHPHLDLLRGSDDDNKGEQQEQGLLERLHS